MFVDSHAHLTSPDFREDLDNVIARARDAGVTAIICPGTDCETSIAAIALAESNPMVYACVGFHPHDASKADGSALNEIEKLSHHPKVVAIGEIGLDYHYDFSPRDVQRSVFAEQIRIAQRRDLPIVVHSRESEEDVVRILSEAVWERDAWRSAYRHPDDRYPGPRGVFHCFPGNAAMARAVINMGFYISMPGPVTFTPRPNKTNTMADVASVIPADHILLETDSPYLAPVPHRGKRNEPSHIPLIAQKIADIQGYALGDIARTSTFGVHRLFGIGDTPEPRIAYTIRNSLYLNITIRCNADCIFCDRKGAAVIKGNNLKIEREPSIEEVIRAIGDPKTYDEVVFCGYGEPTIRMDVVTAVAQWVRRNGGTIRLNTDGHGTVINGRNIVPELVGLVDMVSISLNSTDPGEYGRLMRVDGSLMFPAMVEFARECVRSGIPVSMTMVDEQGVDREQCRKFVEHDIGAVFRERPYI